MPRQIITIIPATTPEQVQIVRSLFEEYARGLNISLCFQNFSQELAELPGGYAPPAGRLLLACVSDQVAGCVGVRSIEPCICEMKRLYVPPHFRGEGIGKRLASAAVREARQAGYKIMRLDTLDSMKPAVNLYRKLGFRPIDPYYHNPLTGVAFLELKL